MFNLFLLVLYCKDTTNVIRITEISYPEFKILMVYACLTNNVFILTERVLNFHNDRTYHRLPIMLRYVMRCTH